MTDYGEDCLRDYIKALIRAERLLRDAEHDVHMVKETQDLYSVSCHLREALNKVQEGMYQAVCNKKDQAND